MFTLKHKIRILKVKAQGGSHYAVRELGKIALTDIKYFEDVMSTILNILPVQIPNLPTTRTTDLAQTALLALAGVLLHDDTALQKDRCWPHIWAWVSFLYDSYLHCLIEGPRRGLEGISDQQGGLLFTLLTALHPFSCDSSSAYVLTSPGCSSLIIRLFLLSAQILVQHDNSHRHGDKDPLELSQDIMVNIQQYHESSWLLRVREALDCHAPPHLASGLLRRVQQHILDEYQEAECHNLQLALSAMLKCSESCSKFNLALVGRGSISLACRVLKWVGKQLARGFSTHISCLARFVVACTGYLLQTFAQCGHEVVLLALREGLLKSILSCGPVVDSLEEKSHARCDGDKEHHYWVMDLLDVIAGYTAYYSVCTVLFKALRRAEMVQCSSASLLEDFMAFRKFTYERIADKVLWDKLGFSFCANRQCTLQTSSENESARAPVYRCTGCGLHYFCSKECQKAAWKDGHREVCKKLRENRFNKDGTRNPSPILSSRDQHFHRWLMNRSIIQERSNCVDHQYRYLSENPMDTLAEPVVSVLRYDVFPRVIETVTLEEAKELASKIDWDSLVMQGKTFDHPLVLTVTPFGKYPVYWAAFGDDDQKVNLEE
ncbi:hypothetical protein VNI00_009924 [Paramarasmius palmivorus]|uniref:MYND-type domain-containing protein n=1 Tax=Paramarasmius palmivorus TaxID=297713 RepID=A0AAW0CP90_9AGAR